MSNQQLIDYIKQSFSRGFSKEQIKSALLERGWPEEEIEMAFSEVESAERDQLPPQPAFQLQPARKLPGFNALVKETFRIFFANWLVLLGIAALPYIFLAVFSFLASILLNVSPLFSILFFVVFLTYFIFLIWSYAALIFALRERERKIGIIAAYILVKDKLISYYWVNVLTLLVVLGGFFLFFIPSIIFSVWFGLAPLVLIYEGLRGRKALFRSKQLVEGSWWNVFIKVGVFNFLIAVIFTLFFGILAAVLSIISQQLSDLASTISSILTTPISLTFLVLIYEGLKKIKVGQAYEEPKNRFRIFTNILIVLGILPPILAIFLAIALIGLSLATFFRF
jgi:hypothetical protein